MYVVKQWRGRKPCDRDQASYAARLGWNPDILALITADERRGNATRTPNSHKCAITQLKERVRHEVRNVLAIFRKKLRHGKNHEMVGKTRSSLMPKVKAKSQVNAENSSG
jgi:hypothetical protein